MMDGPAPAPVARSGYELPVTTPALGVLAAVPAVHASSNAGLRAVEGMSNAGSAPLTLATAAGSPSPPAQLPEPVRQALCSSGSAACLPAAGGSMAMAPSCGADAAGASAPAAPAPAPPAPAVPASPAVPVPAEVRAMAKAAPAAPAASGANTLQQPASGPCASPPLLAAGDSGSDGSGSSGAGDSSASAAMHTSALRRLGRACLPEEATAPPEEVAVEEEVLEGLLRAEEDREEERVEEVVEDVLLSF